VLSRLKGGYTNERDGFIDRRLALYWRSSGLRESPGLRMLSLRSGFLNSGAYNRPNKDERDDDDDCDLDARAEAAVLDLSYLIIAYEDNLSAVLRLYLKGVGIDSEDGA
jgi:hypothetical protein